MAVRDTDYYQNASTGVPDWLVDSFAGSLVRLFPAGACPLFGLTGMMGKTYAKAIEHGYFSKTMVFPSIKIDNFGGYNSAATTFTVDSTASIVDGDLLRFQSTGEVVRVASVASGTSVVVVRANGQVAAAAIANDANAYYIGNSFEQASNKPTARGIKPARIVNNTQIHRNGWVLSRTLAAVKNVIGLDEVAENKMDAAHFHGQSIENMILFGQKSAGFLNGQYISTADGIVERVRRDAPAANTSVASSTTNYTQLQAMLNPCFDTMSTGQGSGNKRFLFVGGHALTVINDIGRLSGQYQIVDGQPVFGLQFQTFRTSRGMFSLMEHPMLNTNAEWQRMAIAVDLSVLKVAPLEGRDTFHEQYGSNGQVAGNVQDAVGGVYTTENTVELTNPSACAVIYNLTAGAAG